MSLRYYSLALYKTGNIDEAIRWGMRLWTIDPTDLANANNLAWILATEKKDLNTARDMIERVIRLMPNQPQLLDTAGWIAFLSGRYDAAGDLLQSSLRQVETADARYHQGRLFEVLQRADEARAEYEKALKLGLQGKDKQDAEKRLKELATPQ